METLYDRMISDPARKKRMEEGCRRLVIYELATGREYRKAGLLPTFLPTDEEIENEVEMPTDSKAVSKKKDRIIRRVHRLMRNPVCRWRLWGDIADLPIERLKQIAKEEWKEWRVKP